jgi:hypothetical protein
LTLAVVVAATGCGGGKKADDDLASKKASASSETTTTAAAASGEAGSSTGASKAKSNASTRPTMPGPPTTLANGRVTGMPDWFTVTVEKKCVHAQDTQTFTVKGGIPGQLLIYDTVYYDEANKTGTSHHTNNYGTGSGHAKFDEKGNYTGTYVLAQAVPASTAYLSAATAYQGQLIQARTTYTIKPLRESCG